MPIGLVQPLPSDLDGQDEAAAALPVPQSERYRVITDDARQVGRSALHFFSQAVQAQGQVEAGLDPIAAANPGGRISAEEANARYGGDVIRFNQPLAADDAAWQAAQARERLYRDQILSHTRSTPLRDMGAGLLGALTDPAGAALMLTTDGFGEAALGTIGLARASEVGAAVARTGRLGNLVSDGTIQLARGAALNAPYVGADWAARAYAGDDYSAGDALRDIAAGAILHTGLHLGGHFVSTLLGHTPEAGDAAGTPPQAVAVLPPDSRAGAFAKAIDDLAGDRPVDVGQYVQRELDATGLGDVADAVAAPEAETRFAQDGQAWRASDAGGDVLAGRVDPAALTIEEPSLAESRPGLGLGLSLYERAARTALESGRTLESPPLVEADSARVWAALQRRGFTVEQSPMAAETWEAGRGRLHTLDGSPVFRVTAAPERPPPAATAFKPAKGAKVPRVKADPGTPQGMLAETADRFARNDPPKADLRAPGRAATPAAEPKPLDLSPPAPEAKGAKGGKPKVSTADRLIAADPELKALAESTERLIAANGLEVADAANHAPSAIAEAIRAAAVCLIGELG